MTCKSKKTTLRSKEQKPIIPATCSRTDWERATHWVTLTCLHYKSLEIFGSRGPFQTENVWCASFFFQQSPSLAVLLTSKKQLFSRCSQQQQQKLLQEKGEQTTSRGGAQRERKTSFDIFWQVEIIEIYLSYKCFDRIPPSERETFFNIKSFRHFFLSPIKFSSFKTTAGCSNNGKAAGDINVYFSLSPFFSSSRHLFSKETESSWRTSVADGLNPGKTTPTFCDDALENLVSLCYSAAFIFSRAS